MTCIIGFCNGTSVYMVGDKSINDVDEYTMTLSESEKVFKKSNMLIGYTGCFKLGQVLEFKWIPPNKNKSMKLEEYLHNVIIPSMKKTLKENHLLTDKDNLKEGMLLLGIEGRLFKIQSNFSVLEPSSISMPDQETVSIASIGLGEITEEAVFKTSYGHNRLKENCTMYDKVVLSFNETMCMLMEHYAFIKTDNLTIFQIDKEVNS